ncbi:hypothetical protein ABEB36_007967 [Hypothenemus hampei]|uniref:Uncharacterized protein n=1 Tax=Hypothenemus hampei TaxID=57062 RepID=A0ABD1EK80_HYPHA
MDKWFSEKGEQDLTEKLCNQIQILEKMIYKAYKPKGDLKNSILQMAKTAKKIMDDKKDEHTKQQIKVATNPWNTEIDEMRLENEKLREEIKKLEQRIEKEEISRKTDENDNTNKVTVKYINQILQKQGKKHNKELQKNNQPSMACRKLPNN